MKGKVSIFIPTHKRAGLLARALQAVVTQTYQNLEILVVDDHSGDETEALAREVASKDARVKYLLNAGRGACAARNTAIAEATGEWITGCDDDDYFSPDRVSGFVSAWEDLAGKGESFSALYADYFILGSRGTRRTNNPRLVGDGIISVRNAIGNQVFARTESVRAVGGFDEGMPAWQDYDLWVRLIRRYGPIRKIDACSYVLDQAHDSNRISVGSQEKLRAAYEKFVGKHAAGYTRQQAALLELSLLQYKQVPFTVSDLWKGVKASVAFSYLRTYAAKRWRGAFY